MNSLTLAVVAVGVGTVAGEEEVEVRIASWMMTTMMP